MDMAVSRNLASKLRWSLCALRYNAQREIGAMGFLRERSGAWSPGKIIAFAGAVAPALWLAGRVWLNDLGQSLRPSISAAIGPFASSISPSR
jgi:hypothetical protein